MAHTTDWLSTETLLTPRKARKIESGRRLICMVSDSATDQEWALLKSAPELAEALKAAHDWRGLCDENSLETFERIADLFRRDTGMLRPGKDQAMALGGHPTDEERDKAWREWCERKNAELDAKIRAALAKANIQ